jgi:membrane protease YdiL (CAAX protease family)
MLSDYVRRFQLPLFFLLCLIISWAVWIPQAVTKLSNPQTPFAGGSPLNMLAVWAPALSAILLSRVTEGKAGLQALSHPVRRWRVGIQWYLFILLYPAAIWFLARAIDTAFGRSFEFTIPILTYFPPEQTYMVAVALVSAFPNTLGEELGWRGFALPRLQAKYNALVSSITLGFFWAVWHVPMWIANDIMGLGLLRSVVTITMYAIIFTWVYNNTGGSVLLAWLFHASATITQYTLQIPLTLTGDIVRWGVAILVVVIAGSAHLSRKGERYRLPRESLAG